MHNRNALKFLLFTFVVGFAQLSFASGFSVNSHEVTPSNAAGFGFEVLAEPCNKIEPNCQFLLRVPNGVSAAELTCRDGKGPYLYARLRIFEKAAIDPKSSQTPWDIFFAKPFRGVFIQLRKDSFDQCSIIFERHEPPQGWTSESWVFKSWGAWAGSVLASDVNPSSK